MTRAVVGRSAPMPTSDELNSLVDELYGAQERISREEIHARAVAAGLPADDMTVVDRLPEGEYAEDELTEALAMIAQPSATALSVDEPVD